MPKFEQRVIEIKTPTAKALPQELVDEYVGYIEKLEKGNEGLLEFIEGENVAVGRKALLAAGVQSKKYVKVSKVRGVDNVLKFVQMSKKEWDEKQAQNMERGKKIRKARQGKK